jgi:two-component system response regulator RegX3
MASAAPRVVIIGMNGTLGTTLQKKLSQYGYQVLPAKDEEVALDQCQHLVPAMVLIEREQFRKRLPEVIGTLWRNAALKQVPVVTVGNPQMLCSEEECAKDLDWGFDAYLCNMTSRQIVAYARAILRTVQHSRAPQDVLEVDRVRMDLARHEVRVDDQLVELTPREFMILKELMKKPRVVLSRQELLNRVWGEDYALEEHALNVHIHALRQKIERDCSKPTRIVTIRGVGYKLIQAVTGNPSPLSREPARRMARSKPVEKHPPGI